MDKLRLYTGKVRCVFKQEFRRYAGLYGKNVQSESEREGERERGESQREERVRER